MRKLLIIEVLTCARQTAGFLQRRKELLLIEKKKKLNASRHSPKCLNYRELSKSFFQKQNGDDISAVYQAKSYANQNKGSSRKDPIRKLKHVTGDRCSKTDLTAPGGNSVNPSLGRGVPLGH